MSSVQHLRDFISERLTAAAVEIFSVFERTIVQYETEIDRQRRLLDISWKPQIKSHRAEPIKQHVCEEEQQGCYQKNASVDRVEPIPPQIKKEEEEPEPPQIKENQNDSEPPQIKEEQEELCTSQDGEQLVVKEETDVFMVPVTYGESDYSESDSDSEQLLSHNSPAAESQDQNGSKHVDLVSTGTAELKPMNENDKNINPSNNVDNSSMSETQCDTDTGKKSIKCGFCGKTFTRKFQLKKHQRIHTGERPYSCEICGKSFIGNDKLLVHMRTHTGEKPYPCTTCGKRFTDPSALRRHAGIHTGKKPHSCKTCGKSFRQRGHLIVHLRIHTGEKPFMCNLCGKRFIQTSNLKSHMRIHTGEKRYSCALCGKNFGHNHSMLYHVKTQHK